MNNLEIIEHAIENGIDCILTVTEESDLFGDIILTRCHENDILKSVTYKIENKLLSELKNKLEAVDVPKNNSSRKNSKSKN